MALAIRWMFLRRAFLPQILVAVVAAFFCRSLDPKGQELAKALDALLAPRFAPDNTLRSICVWTVDRPSRFLANTFDEPWKTLVPLFLLHVAGWYWADINVTGRLDGWQLIAPQSAGTIEDHCRTWCQLAFILAVIIGIPFLPLLVSLDETVDRDGALAKFWRGWPWTWSCIAMESANGLVFIIMLLQQRAFRSFEQNVFPRLMMAAQERREQKRQKKVRRQYQRQLRLYYQSKTTFLAKAFPKEVFNAAVQDATGDHLSLDQVAKNASELLAKLEGLASREGDRFAKDQQELAATQQEHGRLVTEISATQDEYDRLVATNANTSLVEEHLAKLQQRFRELDQKLRDVQSRIPPRTG